MQYRFKAFFNELKQFRIFLFLYFIILLGFCIFIIINYWVPSGETVRIDNITKPYDKAKGNATNITLPVVGPIDKAKGNATNITLPAAGAAVTTRTTTTDNSTARTINIQNFLEVKGGKEYLLNETENSTPKDKLFFDDFLRLRSQEKEVRLLSLSALFGFMGACISGITSILTRKIWSVSKYGTSLRLVYVYFARPWVGTSVAIVTYIALRAGLVNMGEADDVQILSDFGIAAIGALVGLMSDEMILRLRDVFRTFFGLPTLQGTEELLLSLPKNSITLNEKIQISAILTEPRSSKDLSAYFFVDDESIVNLDKKEEKFNDFGTAIVTLQGIKAGRTFITVIVRAGLELYVSRELTVIDQEADAELQGGGAQGGQGQPQGGGAQGGQGQPQGGGAQGGQGQPQGTTGELKKKNLKIDRS